MATSILIIVLSLVGSTIFVVFLVRRDRKREKLSGEGFPDSRGR